MTTTLDTFVRRHDFLVCVDSDGCAIDNLTAKHRLCFAPCLIREWRLEAWSDRVTALWERINLNSLTRGIHRYRALALALEEIHRDLKPVEDLPVLIRWVEYTEDFSEASLEREIQSTASPLLKKARHWSAAANRAIGALSWDRKQVFPGVREALTETATAADIAVISSANREAVLQEWEHGGLASLADGFLCQEAGKKTRLIAGLCRKGYPEGHILVIGDAPSDRAGAELNGVSFFPVLVGREPESWAHFPYALRMFLNGSYQAEQARLSEEFMQNLSGGQVP